MGGRRGQDLARLQTLVQIRIQIRTLTLRLVQTVIRGCLLLDLLVVGEDGSDGVAEVVRLRLHREQEPIVFNVFPVYIHSTVASMICQFTQTSLFMSMQNRSIMEIKITASKLLLPYYI